MRGIGCVSVALLFVFGCASKPAPEPVLLGMLQPLSGVHREQGESARQAVDLAVRDLLNRDVRINGRALVVLHAESGDSPAQTRAETVRLLAVNRVVAVVGAVPPTEGEILLREARLLTAPAVLAGEAANSPGADGLLSLGAGPTARGRAMAKYVRESLKVERIGVLIDESDPVAVNFAAAFVRELRAEPPILFEEIRHTAAERPAALKKLADFNPKAVLRAGPPEPVGLKVPILDGSSDTGATPPADEEHYRVTVFAGTDLTLEGREFVRKYRESYGRPPDLGAALSWEAVQLVATLMSGANSASSLRLRELLTNPPPFAGLTGSIEFKDRQAKRRLFAVKTVGGTPAVTPLGE